MVKREDKFNSEPDPDEKNQHEMDRQSIDQRTPAEDPMDSLIEDLRDEFKRGLELETAKKKAGKRNRLVALTFVIAPAGLILTTALLNLAHHNHSNASRQEARYGY